MWKKLKLLLIHFAKEKCSSSNKRQPKLTKIKLNLNRSNQKLKAMQPVKTMKKKEMFFFPEKERNVEK